jgi:uncharacterized protein YozE (UPF0346 family)
MNERIILQAKHMTPLELAEDFYREHKHNSVEMFNKICSYLEERQKVNMNYFYEVRNILLSM